MPHNSMLMPKGKVTKKDVINTPSPEALNTADQAASDALKSGNKLASTDGNQERLLSTVGAAGATTSSTLRLVSISTPQPDADGNINEDGYVFVFYDGELMPAGEPRKCSVFYDKLKMVAKHAMSKYVVRNSNGQFPIDPSKCSTLTELAAKYLDQGPIVENWYVYNKNIYTAVYEEAPLTRVEMTIHDIINDNTKEVVHANVYLLNKLMGDLDAQSVYVEEAVEVHVE